jgi:hypothetical protein
VLAGTVSSGWKSVMLLNYITYLIIIYMKKMILSVVVCAIALTTIGTVIVSCEKERDIKQSATLDSKKPGNGEAEKIMPPFITITNLSGICKNVTCAPNALFTINKRNRIQITKDAYTLANYPANMRYTIYKKTTLVSGNLYNIERIDEFNCTQNAPVYSSQLLDDATIYYVRITDAAGGAPPQYDVIDITTPSPAFPFTSGTDKGDPC